MKSTMFATVALVGSVLLPLAHAQVNGPIQGKIPFSFYVGNKAFPAGNYVVRPLGSMHNVLAIQNAENNAGALTIVPIGVQAASAQNTKLVFHRYGNTYFLSQVWQGLGRSEGLQLVPSKAERELAARMMVAMKPGKAEVASIPFRRK
jgi:hypothetical protein